MVEQIMARLEDFTLQYREINNKPLFVELGRMKANLKLPSVSVDVDTMSLVPTDMVGKVDVNACELELFPQSYYTDHIP